MQDSRRLGRQCWFDLRLLVKAVLEIGEIDDILVCRNVSSDAFKNGLSMLKPDGVQLLVFARETCCGLDRRARKDVND
jgi:hypothetical protein